jgi:hypothetical protein
MTCRHCRDAAEHVTETRAGQLCPRCLAHWLSRDALPPKPRRGWPFVDEPSREKGEP